MSLTVYGKETWNECCPHCARYISDLWEYGNYERDFTFDCPHCEKPINGVRIQTVDYCLRPATHPIVQAADASAESYQSKL